MNIDERRKQAYAQLGFTSLHVQKPEELTWSEGGVLGPLMSKGEAADSEALPAPLPWNGQGLSTGVSCQEEERGSVWGSLISAAQSPQGMFLFSLR